LPKAVWWMYGFQITNGVNFTIALGTPMVLIGRFLGAREALIGLILALTPFLNVLQMLASNTAERWGYKRIVLAGWGTRSFAILLAAPLPLLHGQTLWGWAVPDSALLAALITLLFVFNCIRGLTCVGWVPWVSQVVPEEQRGRFFGWDQTSVNTGVLVTLLVAGFFVGNDPIGVPGWKYAVLLGVSWLAGWLSVQFLKPVPCTMPAAAAAKASRSWADRGKAYREVWRHKPFRRLVYWQALNSLAWGAYGGFTTIFMRDKLNIGEGHIMGIAAAGTIGVILTSILWGRFSDRYGSRPTMRLAGIGQLAVLAVWGLAAAGLLSITPGQIFVLSLAFGIICAGITIPFLKLYMASFPKGEMTIAVTLNTVITSICAGCAPLVWGWVLEMLGTVESMKHGLLRPFSVFFGVTAILTILLQVVLTRIHDTKSMPTLKLVGLIVFDWPRQFLADTLTLLPGQKPRGK